jgi:ABC-type glycerol-3-phosphate transport system substrate-binding protein
MDENVVFNNNQQNDASSGDAPPAPDAGQTGQPVPPVDPNAAQPTPSSPDQIGVQSGLTAEQPADATVAAAPATEQPTDSTPAIDPATGQPVTDPNAVVDPSQATDEAQLEAGVAPPPPPPAGFLGGKLKKILIGLAILIALIVLVIMLMPKSEGTQQVKLQWWGLWEENAAVQSLIADFKKEHPNIDIEYQKRTPQEYRDRLLARVDNGSGPDIFRYHNTWRPMLGKVLLPLSSDVISPDEFQEVYYPVVQKDLVSKGAIYGIPLNMDSLSMFVNPKLFEAAGVQVPNNWEEFVKVSKQLTVKDSTGKIKTAGAALGTYDNIKHAPDIISMLFAQQGVQMDKFTASPKTQEDALKFYTSFSTGENNVWDPTLDNSILAFSRGNLAIYFGYSWDVFAIQKLNKDLQFKIYPVPANGTNKTTIVSYWVEGVNAKSPNKKAALEFMKYLAKKETAEKFYAETAKTRAFGEPYPRKDLRENLREEPLVYPFLSQLDNATSTMFVSDTHDGDTGLNTSLNTYLGTAVRSLIDDNDSPDKAVEGLNSGVLQVYKKYDIIQAK